MEQQLSQGAGHHSALQHQHRGRVLLIQHQQHFVSAGHLPIGDLHSRAEVRAHPSGHHGPRAHQVPEQRGGAAERLAVQVLAAEAGGGHLEY